jgi:hypothetical protein
VAGTLLRNEREYAIRIQYRIGITGEFTDLENNGKVIEHVTSADGDIEYFDHVALPPELLNREYVQLLWKYYHVSGENGSRAKLRLDDILIGAVPDNPDPEIYIKIYPNPASRTVTVESEREIEYVRLVSISGQVFHIPNADGLVHTIDISELQSGLYFIEVTTSVGIIGTKVQIINHNVP